MTDLLPILRHVFFRAKFRRLELGIRTVTDLKHASKNEKRATRTTHSFQVTLYIRSCVCVCTPHVNNNNKSRFTVIPRRFVGGMENHGRETSAVAQKGNSRMRFSPDSIGGTGAVVVRVVYKVKQAQKKRKQWTGGKGEGVQVEEANRNYGTLNPNK